MSNGHGSPSPSRAAVVAEASDLRQDSLALLDDGDPLIDRLRGLGQREAVVFPDPTDDLIAQLHGAGFHDLGAGAETSAAMAGWREGLGILLYVVRGRGRLRGAEGEPAVDAGQVLLLRCRPGHDYQLEAEGRMEFFYLALVGREALRVLDEIIGHGRPAALFEPRNSLVTRAAQACREALARQIESPFRGSELAYDVLMALLADVECRLVAPATASATSPSFLPKVDAFCQAHLERNIRVEQMAGIANLSRFHFSREFRKAIGVSPAQYLLRLRLEKAIGLLRAGSSTLAEVARACGFKDASYFCLVFRKRFGTTPGKFRRSGR